MEEPLLFPFFTLVGLVVASFLNVCIDRLPRGQSLLFPASHCPSCQRRLAARDLIPVFSYLWLRGRCRYCRTPVPRRVLWVEVATGALFPLLYWRYGLTVSYAVVTFYCCLFLVMLVIDLEHGLILNKVVYPAMGIAAIITLLSPEPWQVQALKNAAIASAIGAGLFVAIAIISFLLLSKEGMGIGDIKMAGLIGLVTGFPQVFVALFIAILLGGVVAVALLLLKIKKRKEGIPFGPFLSIGAVATVLFGNILLGWYLGPWFG